MTQHVVTEDEDGTRIDKCIMRLFPDVGYVFLQKLFRLKKIKVNNQKVTADYRVTKGDVVSLYLNEKKRSEQSINEANLLTLRKMIVFENESIIAINKPSGLAVQSGTKIKYCVESLLKGAIKNYHLVHRLDKDTSGILLIEKNLKSAQHLTKLFRENKIHKTYYAVADGKIHGKGIISNLIGKVFVSGEEKMSISDDPIHGKLAITEYRSVKIYKDKTLLELKPKTGRKHQLRVHCAEALNAPILGDTKYNKNNKLLSKKLLLHAQQLEIPEMNIIITADFPKYWAEFHPFK